MKRLQFLLLFLLLGLPAAAQGRLNMVPGRWQGPVKGVGIVTLEIGDTSTKTFKIGMQMMTAEARSAVAEGHYQVISNQGKTQLMFRVDTVRTLHLETDQLHGFSFAGWSLRPGAEVRATIEYQNDILQLDGFDPDNSEHSVRFRLQQVE